VYHAGARRDNQLGEKSSLGGEISTICGPLPTTRGLR
jgi:hypothetical protein